MSEIIGNGIFVGGGKSEPVEYGFYYGWTFQGYLSCAGIVDINGSWHNALMGNHNNYEVSGNLFKIKGVGDGTNPIQIFALDDIEVLITEVNDVIMGTYTMSNGTSKQLSNPGYGNLYVFNVRKL